MSDYFLVLSHPKRFNDHRAVHIGISITRATFFFAISLVLSFALSIFLLPQYLSHWQVIAVQAILYLVTAILSVLVLRASWFVVGGRASLRSHFLIYSYHAGVLMIWATIVSWLSDIVLRVFDPALYVALYGVDHEETTGDELESLPYLVGMAIVVAGLFVMFAWWIVGWGAYRKLNGLSRTRSVIAFLIATVLYILIVLAQLLFGAALFPADYDNIFY